MRYGYTLLSFGDRQVAEQAIDLAAVVDTLERAGCHEPRGFFIFLPESMRGRVEHAGGMEVVFTKPLPSRETVHVANLVDKSIVMLTGHTLEHTVQSEAA